MDFGKMLNEERIRQGISIPTLAKKVGVSPRAISYWESGERKMSADNADKVFKALNVSIVIGKKDV